MKKTSFNRKMSKYLILLCLLAGNAAGAQQPQQDKPQHHGTHRKPESLQRPAYSAQAPATSSSVPNYASNVLETKYLTGTVKSGKPPTTSIFISTKDPPTQVIDWYKTQLPMKGWTLDAQPAAATQNPMAQKGKALTLHASKDDYILFMYVAHVHKVQPCTVINVAVGRKQG